MEKLGVLSAAGNFSAISSTIWLGKIVVMFYPHILEIIPGHAVGKAFDVLAA